MTTEQKRLALAKFAGHYEFGRLPKYFTDLNACKLVEVKLSRPQFEHYTSMLFAACDDWPSATVANAEQRAEALGKTLNLW